jgi:CBS domain-containing protein
MKARDVMSSPVIFLRPRVPADVAAALLVAHGYTAAPVVDEDGLVVGIATEADLVRGTARSWQSRARMRAGMRSGRGERSATTACAPAGLGSRPAQCAQAGG